uniref:Hsp70-binding protein 1 n=1 Tax=Neovison vison TaxID=452646 RepID=A0A8C7EQ95_NEOVI
MSAAFRGQREEVEQMKNCLRVLSQPTPSLAAEAELASDQQEREGALELLADLCENMDNAADFCQLSGMHLLVGRYLEAGPAGLRWRAAQLIGTCSQNVAAIQEQVLGLGALRKLLRLLDRDTCDLVRVKALFAISCLVREQEAGLLQFLRLDGFSVLMRAMQQQVQKLKVKSAFLLQNLLVGHPEHKGTLCSMGMVQQLVALIRTEHSPFHEHVLGALCRYAGASEGARPGAGAPTSRRTPLGSSPTASSPLGFRTWEHSFLLTCGGLTRQPGRGGVSLTPLPPAPAAHGTYTLASGKDNRTEQRLEQVAAPACGVAAGQALCRASCVQISP